MQKFDICIGHFTRPLNLLITWNYCVLLGLGVWVFWSFLGFFLKIPVFFIRKNFKDLVTI